MRTFGGKAMCLGDCFEVETGPRHCSLLFCCFSGVGLREAGNSIFSFLLGTNKGILRFSNLVCKSQEGSCGMSQLLDIITLFFHSVYLFLESVGTDVLGM